MKDKILGATIEVLALKGIHHTTIRDIAHKLEMSDGHLRYYFKTKEELLLYTFRSLEDELSKYTTAGTAAFKGVDTLKAIMHTTFALMVRYSFFFVETPYSLSGFPVLAEAWKVLFEQRKKQFIVIFEHNKANGIFRKDISDKRYELLSEQFFILSENWIKHSKSFSGKTPGEKEIAHMIELMLALLLPYFTKKFATQIEAELG